MIVPDGFHADSARKTLGVVSDSVGIPSHAGAPPVPSRGSRTADLAGVPHRFLDEKRLSEKPNDSTEIEQLVCARCQPLETRIAELEADRLALIVENTEFGNEFAGLQHTLRKQGAEIVHLRNELRKTLEEEEGSEVVKALLERWATATGRQQRKGRKADLSVSGKRGQVVKKALRMQNAMTRKRYTADEIGEAIDGLGLLPYVGPKGRQAVGEPAQRYDDVEHALRDEPTIDRFRIYAERGKEQSVDALWQIHAQHDATAQHYWQLLLNAAAKAACAAEDQARLRNIAAQLPAVAA